MGTKIQGKPLYASLVAILMAVVLDTGGVGMALGNPDSSQIKYVLDEIQSEGIFWLENEGLGDGCYEAFGDMQAGYSYQINGGKVIEKKGFYAGGLGGLTVNLNDLNLNCGDTVTINVWHVGGNDVVDASYKRVIRVVDDSTSNSALAFHLDFKATGVQATGFKDYKETFAAMNS